MADFGLILDSEDLCVWTWGVGCPWHRHGELNTCRSLLGKNWGWERSTGRWRHWHLLLMAMVVIGVQLHRLLKAQSWDSHLIGSRIVLHPLCLVLLYNIGISGFKKNKCINHTGVDSLFLILTTVVYLWYKCFSNTWIQFLLILIFPLCTPWLIYYCFGYLSRLCPTEFLSQFLQFNFLIGFLF